MKTYSATEENYLKAIYKFSEDGNTVSTNTISRFLQTTPASVTDMVKRLSEKKLVDYQPYKGVLLTAEGQTIALKTIRKHRLWEVFLVKTLNFSWDAVHETAEQLEHINSPELIDKLDEFLGFPKFDPHGDPIPSPSGEIVYREATILGEVSAGSLVEVVSVSEDSGDFLRYLDRIGVNLGTRLSILERIAFDQTLLLDIDGREIMLSGEFTKRISVIEV